MLRISTVESEKEAIRLQLEGRVVGRWVAELSRSCVPILEQGRKLTLDLGGVSFVDRDGIALMRGLMRRQVVLENYSTFVAIQLWGRP